MFAIFKDKSDENTDKFDPFFFIYQNEQMKNVLKNHGRAAVIDATFGTNRYQWKLFAIVVLDSMRKVRIGAVFICQCADEEELTKILKIIKDNNPEWNLQVMLSDFDQAQINAVKNNWVAVLVLLCWIHQDRNWGKNVKWLTKPHEFDTVFKKLKEMRYATTEQEFFSLLEKFKKSSLYKKNKGLSEYLVKWLKPETYKMWVYAFRKKSHSNDSNTTNAVESWNEFCTYILFALIVNFCLIIFILYLFR